MQIEQTPQPSSSIQNSSIEIESAAVSFDEAGDCGLNSVGNCQPTTEVPTTDSIEQQEFVFSARQKIVLQCGLSSITLHANGKIVLRGQSIVSAADGINRLSGGQIEIN